MSNFTPGKWIVRELLAGWAVFAVNGGEREPVADCLDHKGNARLIAAAPEMYALLRTVFCEPISFTQLIQMGDTVREPLARIDGNEEETE